MLNIWSDKGGDYYDLYCALTSPNQNMHYITLILNDMGITNVPEIIYIVNLSLTYSYNTNKQQYVQADLLDDNLITKRTKRF